MPKQKLFLIDANAFCYRAYYAIRNLSTSYGQPTNAVYGFINMLKKVLKVYKPQFLGICFDVKGVTFRKEKFADYKINRTPMPDDLSSQMPLIKEAVSAYNLPIFEMEGFEADDVIATITKQIAGKSAEVIIVSADKDMLQLVGNGVCVYNPLKEDVIYDKERVEEVFGVSPQAIADLLSLTGDKIDNIPGVKGIGEVTAKGLIKEFGNLENIFSRLENIKSEKVRALLSEQKAEAILSKELAILNTDVPLKLDLDKFRVETPDYDRLFKLFKKLEFKTLLRELPNTQTEEAKFKLKTIVENDEISAFLNDLSEAKEFVYYFNGNSGDKDKPQDIFLCLRPDEVIKIPLKYSEKLKIVLEDNKILKIGHDIKKDMVLLLKQNKKIQPPLFDVMLAGYLIDPSRTGYALSDLAWEYLEEKLPEDSPEYCANSILRLKPILEKKLKEMSLWDLFLNVDIPLSLVLARMEFTGVTIDKEVLEKLSLQLTKRINELISEIYNFAGCQFNINSPKQLSEILFTKLKLPVVKKTKTGFSTDEEVLNKLSDKHKIVANLLEYRQLVKLKSTYIDALPQLLDNETGRLHTSFNQTGTETGRLSSSNPNLQNIPIKTELGRQIRKAFVPSENDNFLICADYSQIELRILAHLSQDVNLIRAFKEGQDIHRFTAALIFNQKQAETTDEMRDIAKRVNFGIIYGISAYGLSKDLSITQGEASQFIDAYFVRYPKVKEFMDGQIKKARQEGFVSTLLGRRRYLPQIGNTNMNLRQLAERQAINTPVQGTAADLIKLAMINIQEELSQRNLKSRLTIQVHDELIFDCPGQEFDLMKGLIKHSMESVLSLSVPIRVDIKYGKNWLEQKET